MEATSGKDIERLWMTRLLTTVCGAALSLGYIWMQNTYNDQRSLRSDFHGIQVAVAAIQTRHNDMRESNREQNEELKALRSVIEALRGDIVQLRSELKYTAREK